MLRPRFIPPGVRGPEPVASDPALSLPMSALGSELSIVRSSRGTDPEGVLLNIDTLGRSRLRDPAEGALRSIARSAFWSEPGEGGLPDDAFGSYPPREIAPGSWVSIAASSLGRSRAAPQRWQRTARAGFSPLQEGQIMIAGWLGVSYSADYPARFSPSASDICGEGGDISTNKRDFPGDVDRHDAIELMVASFRRNTALIPKRWTVDVSSSPPSRLRAALGLIFSAQLPEDFLQSGCALRVVGHGIGSAYAPVVVPTSRSPTSLHWNSSPVGKTIGERQSVSNLLDEYSTNTDNK
jgi:hypothetical protein